MGNREGSRKMREWKEGKMEIRKKNKRNLRMKKRKEEEGKDVMKRRDKRNKR